MHKQNKQQPPWLDIGVHHDFMSQSSVRLKSQPEVKLSLVLALTFYDPDQHVMFF